MRRKLKIQAAIEEPTVNLTPLIDVVFVILIMFILIAPLLELDKVELAGAGLINSGTSVQETSPIAIHVRKDNTIWYNKQMVNINQLRELLTEAKQKHPKAKPQLFQDKSAQFGIYQSVKNAAESAGFNELDIVLKPA